MRLGLRSTLLLALGALFLLAFVPLLAAIGSATNHTLRDARRTHAVLTARWLATELDAQTDGPANARSLERLRTQARDSAGVVEGLVLLRGDLVAARVGDVPAALPNGAVSELDGERVVATASLRDGSRLAVVTRTRGALNQAALTRFLLLYGALMAAALLGATYVALTFLVVRPLDALARAAGRVAAGGRRFELEPSGPRELAELALSVAHMTERLRAEETRLAEEVALVQRQRAELVEAQTTLVRSERLASVGKLAAGLSHEVGNPLAAIVAMLALVRDGGLDAQESDDFLARMQRETERIQRIVRDLLRFARQGESLDAGGTGRPVEAIDEACALVAVQTPRVRIARVLDLDADARVRLGHEALVQVLLNLTLNAAQAVRDDGRIEVRARADGACVVLTVEDDGPGVASTVRARIFEPFVTTKDVGEGSGLGLAVCRGLVESVGGSIALVDGTLGGACFELRLPTA